GPRPASHVRSSPRANEIAFRGRAARPFRYGSDRQGWPGRGVMPTVVDLSEGRMGVAAGVRGRTGRALRWFIAVGLLLAFGWFFATRLDPAALVRALGGADYRLVLLCAVGHMVILHPLKAWRWSLMLAPMQRISP